jgi:hypothetical protein
MHHDTGAPRRTTIWGAKFYERAADPTRAAKHERRAVGKQGGRKSGRPFFKLAIRASQPTAESYIQRRIDRLIQEKADK